MVKGYTEGNDDFIFDLPGLSGFQLGEQVGYPFLQKNRAFGSAEFTHHPAGEGEFAILGQTGLFQNSGEGHGSNVPKMIIIIMHDC